ncbi:hypothetical protein BDR04DRAFT_1121220 [Suillus decipiens]|nr:hypothetical protein BDR04DRAFT_1121220 [Suillus decipiens]
MTLVKTLVRKPNWGVNLAFHFLREKYETLPELKKPRAGMRVATKKKAIDHAPGSILAEEVGGAPLLFGLARGMGENRGFVAILDRELLGRVVSAVKRAQFTENIKTTKAIP